MELSRWDMVLVLKALDKKIWSMDHVGMTDDMGNPKKGEFKSLLKRVQDDLRDRMDEVE